MSSARATARVGTCSSCAASNSDRGHGRKNVKGQERKVSCPFSCVSSVLCRRRTALLLHRRVREVAHRGGHLLHPSRVGGTGGISVELRGDGVQRIAPRGAAQSLGGRELRGDGRRA